MVICFEFGHEKSRLLRCSFAFIPGASKYIALSICFEFLDMNKHIAMIICFDFLDMSKHIYCICFHVRSKHLYFNVNLSWLSWHEQRHWFSMFTCTAMLICFLFVVGFHKGASAGTSAHRNFLRKRRNWNAFDKWDLSAGGHQLGQP